MKAVNLTELSSIEYNEVFAFVKNAIEESLGACVDDCKSSYKEIEYSDYKNNLIAEVWDDNECLGEGFSVIAFNVIVDDEDEMADMFNDARDEVWESFIEDICECDDECDEIEEAGAEDILIAYDSNSEDDASVCQDYRTIFSDVLLNGGSTRQFAKYFGFSVYNNKEADQLEVYKA